MTKKSNNSYYKKGGNSGGEKTMIHEKTLQFDVMMSTQRKSKKDISNASPREGDREVTHLPNLMGKDRKFDVVSWSLWWLQISEFLKICFEMISCYETP